MKRKIEELGHDRNLLHGLVTAIQMGDQYQVAQVINLIRSNAPLGDVGDCVEGQLESLRQTGNDEAVRGRPARPGEHRRALSVQRLCDRPIIQVPAHPWTTTTDDGEFVSHLISLWFTWQYPYFRWLDQEAFIDAMRAARLDTPFCSRFLVNIMLAEGCVRPSSSVLLVLAFTLNSPRAAFVGGERDADLVSHLQAFLVLARSLRAAGRAVVPRGTFLRRGSAISRRGRRKDYARLGARRGDPGHLVSI